MTSIYNLWVVTLPATAFISLFSFLVTIFPCEYCKSMLSAIVIGKMKRVQWRIKLN